jgi:hypothetical protein
MNDMRGMTKDQLETRRLELVDMLGETIVDGADEHAQLFAELQRVDFVLGEIDVGRPTPLA